MKVGLIDVDGHNFPNLPLMKLSAWHKLKGDSVEWYDPLCSGWYDKVYMSKVFSFTDDYEYPINATEVNRGGSGYCISVVDGKEVYNKSKDTNLPYEIEHIYPDYSIYPEQTKDTAYGFLSRGCPRGCDFCIVKDKEGRCAYKVADLSEFWNGQGNIVICDPNVIACKEWKELLQQLIDSKAMVDFNQGIDIRMMTDEKAEMLAQMKVKYIHFAWDRYEDKEMIVPKFEIFRKHSKMNMRNLMVYVLVGDRERSVLPTDLERIYWLRDHGYTPFVVVYERYQLPVGHELLKLQRWCNNRFVFRTVSNFQDYMKRPESDDNQERFW